MESTLDDPLIIPELRVLVLTKGHVGSGNEIDSSAVCLLVQYNKTRSKPFEGFLKRGLILIPRSFVRRLVMS